MIFDYRGNPPPLTFMPTGIGWEEKTRGRHTTTGDLSWSTIIKWKAPQDFTPGLHDISWETDSYNARIRLMLRFPHGLFEPQRAKGFSRSHGSRILTLTKGFQEKGEIWLQFRSGDFSTADVFSASLKVTPMKEVEDE